MSEIVPLPELLPSEPVFYPGIERNNLYFHGTKIDWLQKILTKGLEPATTSGKDTLARRISFCDIERYTGGSNGSIIAIRPNEDEMSIGFPNFARSRAVADSLDRIPPERAVFYIPAYSGLPRELFNSIRKIADDYTRTGFNQATLTNSLRQLTSTVEMRLPKIATFLESTPDIHKLSQELVWNELCGFLTHCYDDASFITDRISEVRNSKKVTSLSQFAEAINGDELHELDLDRYVRMNDLLMTIHKVDGLGFETIPYKIDSDVRETTQWVKSLSIKKPGSSFARLLERASSIFAKKVR